MLLDALLDHPAHREKVAAACASSGWHGVVAPAGWITAEREPSEVLVLTALCGFPTGTHHGLVKAAEARLAVHSGATEVLVALDPLAGQDAALAQLALTMEAATPHVPVGAVCGAPVRAQEWSGLLAACAQARGATGALDARGGAARAGWSELVAQVHAAGAALMVLGAAPAQVEDLEAAGVDRVAVPVA